MKSTDAFKNTVQLHLQSVAENDALFVQTLQKPNKNIEDCITYILNTVQKSGCNGFTDNEVYGMAMHYYDEDTIDVGKPVNCKVVVNHHVELTEEEIAKAKQAALDKVFSDKAQEITKKSAKKKEILTPSTPTLF